MALKVAARGRIDPFIVMDVLRDANARAATGSDVMHLEVGQPGTGAPAVVLAAARAALVSDRLGYTDALGTPALRDALARHYRDFYGVEVPASRIVVTTGSSGGFILAFLAAFEAGDRVALAAPGYPAYRNILLALGVEPVLVDTGPDERFQPTPALLDRIEGRLDGLILASPSNPTGTMVDAAGLSALVGWCRARSVRFVSDEIYHGIVYGEPAQTALAFGDDAIVVNSFSKYFSMTGWRLGWLVLPTELVRPVECLAQNLAVSPPTLSQIAAIAVFECHDQLRDNVRRYARNRALLLERLPLAGFADLAAADGAFYLYADVGRMTNDSPTLCRRMLAETGVAITPGVDFDSRRGHRYVRFSFAGDEAAIAAAADRLIAWQGGSVSS
ncbi:MAG: aminotransferase class I/II-fold pyridoxal phosphate-dependent enzyme [Alphaproteobacteria bacterium]|nr:aminotransferase class I/II-fold pyridoxal phosphate-dependent enzyme [Alphaproteobacteria bacterium]